MGEQETTLTTEDWHIVVRTMAARVDELERRLREETKTSMAFCDESCEAEEELTKCQADLAAAQARIAELERQPAVAPREDARRRIEAGMRAYAEEGDSVHPHEFSSPADSPDCRALLERIAAGLTLRQAAMLLKLTPSELSMIEMGRWDLADDVKARMAEVYQTGGE